MQTVTDYIIKGGDFTATCAVIYNDIPRPSFWRHPVKWYHWKPELIGYADLTTQSGFVKEAEWFNCEARELADAWGVSVEQMKIDLLHGRAMPDGFRGIALPDNDTLVFQKKSNLTISFGEVES